MLDISQMRVDKIFESNHIVDIDKGKMNVQDVNMSQFKNKMSD